MSHTYFPLEWKDAKFFSQLNEKTPSVSALGVVFSLLCATSYVEHDDPHPEVAYPPAPYGEGLIPERSHRGEFLGRPYLRTFLRTSRISSMAFGFG